MLGGVSTPIGFRPSAEDRELLARHTRAGESTTDVLRRALRVLDYQEWLEHFYRESWDARDENVNAEPEAW
jgi:antitoxin ParD1/3/4